MNKEEIIINLNTEIQIAENTLEHNKLYSKDEELISYNEEDLKLLLGVRDLIEKQQKVIDKIAEQYEKNASFSPSIPYGANKEELIEFFYREVENE